MIDFECTDDAEVPHTFSGSWSGTAIYGNAGNAVRSLVVSPNVPDEAGRAAVRAAKLTEARAAKPADTGKPEAVGRSRGGQCREGASRKQVLIAAIQAGPIRMRANPRARAQAAPSLVWRMPAISGGGGGFFAGCA